MEKKQITQEKHERYNRLTYQIIGAAMEVHRELGPGLLESIYQQCLVMELRNRGFQVETQVQVPLYYKGVDTGKYFQIDILLEDVIVIELKAVENLLPIHEAQLISYLKLSKKPVGLILNFNSVIMKDGIRRKINAVIDEEVSDSLSEHLSSSEKSMSKDSTPFHDEII